ncbi:MAG: hypothetical protein AABZ67_07550 [Pseudomonadota bacterium]
MGSRFGLHVLLAISMFAGTGLVSAQQVTIGRDTLLYSEASTESKVVTTLKQGASGAVVGKKGAWLNLKTADTAGWLFSFNVRFASSQSAAPSSPGDDSAVVGRLVGPRQQVNVTSTIGMRGLDAEDLQQAQLDPEQLKLLDQFAASKQDAESKAQATGLTAVRVDYLDAKP